MKTPTATSPQDGGFTRLDLLVVSATLALLSVTLLPALARTRADSRSFQCLNNNRELNRASRMWSDDNQDLLLNSTTNFGGVPVWVTGALDFSSGNQSNWDPSVDVMQSPLWTYCGMNLGVWKCPSDKSAVLVNGVAQPRVRSFAMNAYISSGDSFTRTNHVYWKFSQIVNPPPSLLFVFHDVRPDGLDDGGFSVDMAGFNTGTAGRFWDWPGFYHDGAGGFSYADGRGELHRWVDRRTTPVTIPSPGTSAPREQDIPWLQDRATRPK